MVKIIHRAIYRIPLRSKRLERFVVDRNGMLVGQCGGLNNPSCRSGHRVNAECDSAYCGPAGLDRPNCCGCHLLDGKGRRARRIGERLTCEHSGPEGLRLPLLNGGHIILHGANCASDNFFGDGGYTFFCSNDLVGDMEYAGGIGFKPSPVEEYDGNTRGSLPMAVQPLVRRVRVVVAPSRGVSQRAGQGESSRA